MLKGSQITALTLFLVSTLITINTSVAYSKPPNYNSEPAERRCLIYTPSGTIQCPRRGGADDIPSFISEILKTREELDGLTIDDAIKKLEAPKYIRKVTIDDYILLGYFYSLEEKYNQSRAYYLKALELETDDARKDAVKKELEKLPNATFEVKPVEK
ncbi:tetratricopeptide domain-containing protein [Calothrix sp. NIES-4071]|nr:tetratricopeptide domain-containing protein [Calothrix sp. NIES-4071]BAZ61975.1 tetratricopeptide domain-containing protein [Calothrix sp. NIES-4105]